MVLLGVGLFTAGSLLGALSPGPGVLVVARSIQALGSSAFTPAGAALLIAAFPPHRTAAAIGVWTVAGGVSSAAGPVIGGLLIEWAGWRSAFWINVPLGLVVLAVGPRVFPETPRERGRALPDPLGAVLLVAGISLLVLGVVESGAWGWTGGKTLAAFAGGLALLVGLVVRSLRVRVPMLQLDLFRITTLRWASVGMLVFATAWFAMFFGLVLFLTGTWGWSVLRAGVATSPIPLLAGLVGVGAGSLADRTGHRIFLLPGAVVYSGAAVWIWVALGERPQPVVLALASILIGVSSGLVMPSLIAASMTDVPPSRHAVASAINFTLQRIGTTFGVALAITFLTAEATAGLPGFHRVCGLALGGGVLSFLIGLTIDTRPGRT